MYKEHNKKCRALISIDFTESTVEKFDTSLSHLQEFIKYRSGTDNILLHDVNSQLIHDFDFYLKTVRKCQHNSSLKHLKNLKKIICIALANDWIKKDPFYGIQFKHEETNIEFLTQEELERLIHEEFALPRLAVVRDVFVFYCFTGLDFIDVQQLTPNHLIKDNSGAMWMLKNSMKAGAATLSIDDLKTVFPVSLN
ncbi:MAG: site-specific integrase [Tannerella sp.]|nr:site-specific integrase [Tannerella sp.]